MKEHLTMFGVAVVCAVLITAATAQAKPGKRIGRPNVRVVDTRWEHRADRNRDGYVDWHEADRAKKDYMKNRAVVDSPWEQRADRNHDGHVGPHEAARARKQLSAQD